MLATGIDEKVGEQTATQTVAWQHAADSMLNEALRMLFADHGRGMLPLTSVESGVGENHTIGPLLSGHAHMSGIDDHYIITAIHMWCVAWLVFATDNLGNLAGHAAQHLVFRIHQNPFLARGGLVQVSGFVTVMIHFDSIFRV